MSVYFRLQSTRPAWGATVEAGRCKLELTFQSTRPAWGRDDLFSKWLSLSRQRLVDRGEQSPNLWQELCGIRAARHDGYIRSDAMRTRFVHKILSYVVVVASAVVLDFMLTHSHAPAFATTVVIGYLAITEFISILENMQESGVEEAGALVDLIRKRSGVATDKKQETERRNDK